MKTKSVPKNEIRPYIFIEIIIFCKIGNNVWPSRSSPIPIIFSIHLVQLVFTIHNKTYALATST